MELAVALVELANQMDDDRLRARATSARCHAMSYAGRMREAAALATEAIGLAERCGDEPALGEACMTAVQSHNVLGMRDQALGFASRAGEVFRRVNDRPRAGTAEMLAGVVLRMLDRPAEALDRFESASGLLTGSPGLEAQLESNRAEALLDLGRFDQARRSFESAMAGFEAAGQAFGVAIVEGNLADLATRRGELRKGLELFLRASERFRSADEEPEAARLEAEAAELLLAIGDHRSAARRLAGAMEALEQAGMQTEASRARMAFGVAIGLSGQIDHAVSELERARETSASHGQPRSAAKAQALLGRVLVRAERYAEAIAALRSALELEPAVTDRVRTELDLADALVKAGELDDADRALASAQSAGDELGLADLTPELLSLRATIQLARGERAEAMQFVRAAMAGLERVRASLAADRLRASVTGGRAMVFERAASVAIDSGDAALAFETIERSSGRSLGERLGSAPRWRDDATAQLEGDLAALLSQLEAAQADGRGSPAIEGLRHRIDRVEADLAKREIASTDGAAAADAVTGLAAFQRSLAGETTLICVMSTGGGYATLRVGRDSVDLRPAGLGRREAEAKLARLHELVDRSLVRLAVGREPSSAIRESIDALLAELGEGLFAGAASRLSGRVGFCLPGALSMLPLAAVRVGGAAVVERCVPMLVPSPSWAVGADAAHRAGVVIAGIADDQAPGIDREVSEIADRLPGSCVLLGEAATMEAIGSASRQAGVLHLACHAQYAPADPMGSRVRLADGWHSARRVAEMDLRCADVVLSGCETGSVDSVAAGEQFGLVRAALLAGARTVLASRWRLHDGAAIGLFSALHELTGPMPERLAKVQSVAAGAGQHPALWGGMYAIGYLS